MACGMCLVAVVLGFVSSPFFLSWFTGLHDLCYINVDDVVLEEHYDALGYDLSFRGWA